jgi:hypothetical protein
MKSITKIQQLRNKKLGKVKAGKQRKIIKTHDLPQTRHLKVCLGLSGFGGTGCGTSGLSSIGSCVVVCMFIELSSICIFFKLFLILSS